jgi:hypothetical protein
MTSTFQMASLGHMFITGPLKEEILPSNKVLLIYSSVSLTELVFEDFFSAETGLTLNVDI